MTGHGQDHRRMAEPPDSGVPSDPMEATPAVDPRVAPLGAPGPASSAATRPPATTTEAEPDPEQMSLRRRLRQPRTILSIAVPIAIIAIFVAINGEQLQAVPELILAANPWLVLAAFLIFYAGFPLRGWRWSIRVIATPSAWCTATGTFEARLLPGE